MIAANKHGGKFVDDQLLPLIQEIEKEMDIEITGFSAEDFDKEVKAIESEVLAASFQILIECQDEAEQAKLLERFEKEKLNCRALTS